jgi:hypothetical protein
LCLPNLQFILKGAPFFSLANICYLKEAHLSTYTVVEQHTETSLTSRIAWL